MDKMMQNQKINDEKYLQFSCAGEKYAIPLLKVREVIGVPKTTPTPYSPQYFLGIMNLRGKVISIVDLCKKLQVKNSDKVEENAVVIVEIDDVLLGLKVDSVDRVVVPDKDSFSESGKVKGNHKNQFIAGVFRYEEQLIVLFDVDKMLSSDDVRFASKESA